MVNIESKKLNKECIGKINRAEVEIDLSKDEKIILEQELEMAQKECKMLSSQNTTLLHDLENIKLENTKLEKEKLEHKASLDSSNIENFILRTS